MGKNLTELIRELSNKDMLKIKYLHDKKYNEGYKAGYDAAIKMVNYKLDMMQALLKLK